MSSSGFSASRAQDDDSEERHKDIDNVEVWVAFLENTHPTEMETLAEERRLKFWTAPFDGIESRNLDGMPPEETEAFDQRIRHAITTDDS